MIRFIFKEHVTRLTACNRGVCYASTVILLDTTNLAMSPFKAIFCWDHIVIINQSTLQTHLNDKNSHVKLYVLYNKRLLKKVAFDGDPLSLGSLLGYILLAINSGWVNRTEMGF